MTPRCLVLPANEVGCDTWEVWIPGHLTKTDFRLTVCCHFDDNGLKRSPSEGDTCPQCGAVYRHGKWQLEEAPRLIAP